MDTGRLEITDRPAVLREGNPVISIGRTVLYVITEQDAECINRRRTFPSSISDRVKDGTWPLGAQAHIGNPVRAKDIYPAIAVRVFAQNVCEITQNTPVNLKVLLDGSDSYWATSRHEDPGGTPGTWHWPKRI